MGYNNTIQEKSPTKTVRGFKYNNLSMGGITMKTKKIKFNEFMDGSYKVRKEYKIDKKQVMALGTALLPLVGMSHLPVFASSDVTAIPVNGEVVPVGAISGAALSTLIHALDPVIDLIVAVSFPVCSLVIIGSFFFLAFGNEEKCWSGVMRGSLAYILIQMSPVFLNVLEQVGKAV